MDLAIPPPRLNPADINVTLNADARHRIEGEMVKYGINPEEVTLTSDHGVVGSYSKLGWQVTDGNGGVRAEFRDDFEIAMLGLGYDGNLIRLHEEDHTQRLNAANIPQIVNSRDPNLIVMVSGRTGIAMEYFGNQAALNAARGMEPTDAIRNTVNLMNQQNNNYLMKWIMTQPPHG